MSWTGSSFEVVAHSLSARTGLAFSPDRRPSALVGIRRAMTRAGISDPARYAERLMLDTALFDDLVSELTVGETYFFREPAQFRYLRAAILPELRRQRGSVHIIRAWSAGCASGEEAYSLAMTFVDEGFADQTHVLATDISHAALAKAKQGRFTAWSLRGEGASDARRHLRRSGELFLVNEAVRRRVAFESLNLATDVYPSFANGTWGLDLILCRNVLIYFDPETVRSVAGRLFESLAEGGWLLTASTDPPLATAAPFDTVVTDQGVFYRRTQARLAAPIESGVGRRIGPNEAPPAFSTCLELAARPEGARGELGLAFDDLTRGEYARAAERTVEWTDAATASLHVRALANLDPARAERACAAASVQHALSAELHYLRALLLLGLERESEAAESAKRALYLDRSLAIGHFLLGSILRRRGDQSGAWRAYRNARDLCAERPGAEVVPLSDGEPAGRLAALARLQMTQLGQPEEDRP